MLIITNETPCMICKKNISNGEMVLLNNGFVCDDCCYEIACNKIACTNIVKIETKNIIEENQVKDKL